MTRVRLLWLVVPLVVSACECGEPGPGATCDAGAQCECGDGRVSGDEVCDVGISPGEAGACPSGCDDGDDCTRDRLVGADCGTACSHVPTTAFTGGDLCCPTGATPLLDDDCPGACGDGVTSGAETCDTAIPAGEVGACPQACDDQASCTVDLLEGAGTCEARCSVTTITAAGAADGCCPAGATRLTDGDCAASCGDGVVSSPEACDLGVAGSCPTQCDDGLACTVDLLTNGGTCDAICTATPITLPASGDGCCPAGATTGSDTDCSGSCGDGVVQPGENCDTAIAAGVGRCPTSCNDGVACTADGLTGAGTCAAACTSTPITQPVRDDGCCPAGATVGSDNDCPVRCGDAVLSVTETCDTGLSSGPGRCPTTCDDAQPCTQDTLANAGTCTAVCVFTPITTASSGDQCCPPGGTIGTDLDCPARCGDRVITPPETCDDGNVATGDGCSSTCVLEAISSTAFRFTDLDIQDPHFFATVLGCQDVTNQILGFIDGLNPMLQTTLRTDESMPPDGILDDSLVQVFVPLAPGIGSASSTYLSFPRCTVPYTSTTCTSGPSEVRTAAAPVMNQGAGAVCLGTVPMTTRYAFTLPTAQAGGTCYSSAVGTVTFNLAGIPIRLEDTYLGGEYFGAPVTQLRRGLVRGFMSYATAAATVIPAGTTGQASIDGKTIAKLLRSTSTTGATAGGCGSAVSTSDLDVSPDGSTPGWYFYLTFAASIPASYTEN